MKLSELIHYIKRYRRIWKWRRRPFKNWGATLPTQQQYREFEQTDLARSVSMSTQDIVNKITGNGSAKPQPDSRSNVFPVRIYDKDNNFIREITSEEVKAISAEAFKKSTWRNKSIQYKNKHGNAGNREEKT